LLHGRRFTWNLLLATVSFPIIGVDFLQHFQLMVDLMHPADIPKTAIATPFGLFKFLRMTFGLQNAGNTFQRRMDRILAGLDFDSSYTVLR
jgi:hypothetical protein